MPRSSVGENAENLRSPSSVRCELITSNIIRPEPEAVAELHRPGPAKLPGGRDVLVADLPVREPVGVRHQRVVLRAAARAEQAQLDAGRLVAVRIGRARRRTRWRPGYARRAGRYDRARGDAEETTREQEQRDCSDGHAALACKRASLARHGNALGSSRPGNPCVVRYAWCRFTPVTSLAELDAIAERIARVAASHSG